MLDALVIHCGFDAVSYNDAKVSASNMFVNDTVPCTVATN